MRAVATVALSCLFLLYSDLVAASSVMRSRDMMHHHSSLARRTSLTRRAARCNAVPSGASQNSTVSPASGLINSTWLCNGAPSGATSAVTTTDGPNGKQSWLNCGIDGKGWVPPPVNVEQIVTVDLRTSLQSSSSPFHTCAAYLDLFEKYAGQHNLPPILFASFSLQESGCNPATVGGAGEQGLMQITQEKCVDAPNGNCKDPDYNIKTAIAYFAETLKEDNGNIVLSVGRYNGWYPGMTYAKATAAAKTDCCRCQNNLDYLVQFFDGWLLGLNAYKLKLGSIFNLAVCPKEGS